jgi:osmotically inducible lipoprotein OsmB
LKVAVELPSSIANTLFDNEGSVMNKKLNVLPGVVAAVMLLGLAGCAGMSAQDKNTAIGAGVGAVGGAVLTGGSTTGTVGGAAVGGIVGHEINTDK